MRGDREGWEDDLERFVGPSEADAQTAFDRLMTATVPIVERHLRTYLPRDEDRQDVIQEMRIRAWRYRNRFQNRGFASWLSFVKLTAERCTVDLARGRGTELSVDDPAWREIPEEELPVVADFFELTRNRERLYQLADDFWLGEGGEDFERRLLAGKLFYLDGMTWERIASRLRVDRRTLDGWLADPIVLRHVAYGGLYVDNTRLSRHLLDFTGPDEDLNALMMRARDRVGDPPEGWSWPEIYAVLWRYRFARLTEGIHAMPECGLDRAALDTLFDRCRSRFPFERIIVTLATRFGPQSAGEDALKGTALWRRLVFQFASADELPHRDIHDRTAPAAETVGFSLTLGMLNVWLSNGRLAKSLRDYYRSRIETEGSR